MRLKITHPIANQFDANIASAAILQKALDTANKKATAHTATTTDIRAQALAAEAHLAALGISKKDRAGAQRIFVSGESVPNAYKWARTATHLRLERGASDWFLVAVTATEIYQSGGHEQTLLTPAQRDIAVAKLCAGFTVLAQ
jgi:hypothetical protein